MGDERKEVMVGYILPSMRLVMDRMVWKTVEDLILDLLWCGVNK